MEELLELKTLVEKEIDSLGEKFKQNKGLILTESDLKCLIFNNLLKYKRFSKCTVTQDHHIKANALHTELSWYNEVGKLEITPDITILEPRNLSILHGVESIISTLPRKQFEFGGNAIIFELKYIRTKILSESNFYKEIKKDFDKIQRLIEKLNNECNPAKVFCYFIVFTKTLNYCTAFTQFIRDQGESENYKFIIKSAELDF